MRGALSILLLAACALFFTESAAGRTPVSSAPPVSAPLEITAQGMHVRVSGASVETSADIKATIEGQIALTEDTAVSPPLIDDLAYFVKQRLLELGYAEAAAEWRLVGARAEIMVAEGPRYKVGEITFHGAEAFLEEELKRHLLRPIHAKEGRNDAHPPYVKASIEEGAGMVERYVQSQGYLQAAVSAPVATPQPGSATMDLQLSISAGRQFHFGAVELRGETLGRGSELEMLAKDLEGLPYSEVVLENTTTAIADIFRNLGHFQAQAAWQADPASVRQGRVPVAIVFTPGPRHHIASIDIAPDFSKGAARLIHSRFKRTVGKVYSPPDLETQHRSVLDTDVFSRLELTPEVEGETGLALRFTGEEAKRKRLSLYGGYETFMGPIAGVELRAVNILDTGHTGLIKIELSGLGLNGGVHWSDPAFLNTNWSLGADATAQSSTYFDYDITTLAAKIALARQWSRHFSTTLFGEYQMAETESEELTPLELGPDQYSLQHIGLSAALDFRNNPVAPTKGWHASLSVSGGTIVPDDGDGVRFVASELAVAVYQPLTKKWRFSAGARASALATDGDLWAIPIHRRLFNGGANSVRSFPDREMGASSRSGTPLGGTLSQAASAEFSYEIIPNLELAFFADAGALSATEDTLWAAPDDLRYAVGAGLRYKLPVGPLRIDYGYNPDRQAGDPAGALHLTFGFAF